MQTNFIKYLVLVTLFLICMGSSAQKLQLKVYEKGESIGTGINNALCIDLPINNSEQAVVLWKKRMREARAKIKGGKEIAARNAIIPTVSLSAMDVYMKYREMINSTTILFAFNMGDHYLSSKSNPKTFEAAKKYLLDYSLEVSQKHYDNLIQQETEELTKNQHDLDGLKRRRENTERDIERYKQLLAVAEADTLDNNANQAATTQRILDIQTLIETNKKNKSLVTIKETTVEAIEKPITAVDPVINSEIK